MKEILTTSPAHSTEFRWLKSPSGVESLVITVSSFPDRPGGGAPVWAGLFKHILGACKAERRLDAQMLIQFHTMYLGANRLMSPNAQKWMPAMGMGVWPYKDPPRLLTMEDAEEFDPARGFPFLSHPLCRVTAAHALDHCWDTLAGYGTLAVLLSPLTGGKLTQAAKNYLQPRVTEPLFQVYGEYWPLLDSAACQATAAELEEWLAGARLYFRESVEDRTAFLISLDPLESILAPLRPQKVDPADSTRFRLDRPAEALPLASPQTAEEADW